MTEERQRWEHRKGDTYLPVFGDWWGNEHDGFRREWNRLSDPLGSIEGAVLAGLRAQDSDDFNIAVVRNGSIVALLWMVEDMDEEPGVLASLAEAVL